MEHEADCGDDATRLENASRDVLGDGSFRRAPTLSRLLSYLVEKTISGEAEQLKSLTIATEGLGRSIDQAGADTYARVQITRLRKALDIYQSLHGDRDCLVIRPGSYSVLLVPAHASAASPHKGAEGDAARPPSRFASALPASVHNWLGALFLAAMLTGAVFTWKGREESKVHWQKPNFPAVSVLVDLNAPDSSGWLTADVVKRQILGALSAYDQLGAATNLGHADFALEVSLLRESGTAATTITLIDASNDRVVWSRREDDTPGNPKSLARFASRTAFELAKADGVVAAYSRSKGISSDNPYGCWLRFTDLVLSASTVGDDRFEDCSAAWYEAAPDQPIAAMFYGWSLTDRSIVAPSARRSRALLEKAIAVLNHGMTVHPGAARLYVAAMRAHGFAGDVPEMKEAGRAAIKADPGNPNIRALVGMYYVFWNLPEGKDYLLEAFKTNPDPPAWYHIGLAVSAMMGDDLAAASKHIAKVDEIAGSSPMLQLLLADYEARSGHLAKARRILNGEPFKTAFGNIPLETILQRLPVAPAVRDRLRQHLEPLSAMR